MAKVICITNQKGGVGKTTTTHNVGAGLARKKYRVLMIDMDPQGNLTQGVGLDKPENTIYEVMMEGNELPAYKILDDLWIIPANKSLANFERDLAGEPGGQAILGELIEPYKAKFDVLLIDCPPSLNLLTLNAMATADYVIIPIYAQRYSEEGLYMTINTFEKMKKRVNKNLALGGVVFTRFIERGVLARNKKKKIKGRLGSVVFNTFIRENVALQEAPDFGFDIFTYEDMKKENSKWYFKQSNGMIDYQTLTDEIVKRFKLNSKAYVKL